MAQQKQTAPYGSWNSPITSDLIVADAVTLGWPMLDGDNVYWTEMRPGEGGRYVLVRRAPDGTIKDVTPPPFNVRTRVHEYGGGAFTVSEGTIFFSNYKDQRLYRLDPGGEPRPLTPEKDLRYADAVVEPARGRLIAVREDHTRGGEAANTLVSLSTEGDDQGGTVLVDGNDFYSNPSLSADGRRLAYLTWNHPNMPWDGTELWVAEISEDGGITSRMRVAGGPEESIFQPTWSPDGTLFFVSDRTGWWNLYRLQGNEAENLYPVEAEFGLPQWQFGVSSYSFFSVERLVCAYIEGGTSRLALLDTASRRLEPVDLPYTYLRAPQAKGDSVYMVAASPTEAPMQVRLNVGTRQVEVLRRSETASMDPGYISMPQAIEFPTEGGKTAHAFFYPPTNKDFEGPEGEKPPLLVMSHGGPTSAVSGILDMEKQFWTSRGIGVLDVNYGGSTGYGTEYRRRLNGQWGVVDLDDCVNGARYMAERGDADGERLAITGGSAGGYTTMCALTFRDVFKAGASYYGISDLEPFTRETHKFESRYLDRLVGPLPESAEVYRERSALQHVDRMNTPAIFFQGLEDRVVPPPQTERFVEALREKGVPVAYIPFEGEQHGFRKAENIKRSLEAELYFYSRIFGFDLADEIEPVEIANL